MNLTNRLSEENNIAINALLKKYGIIVIFFIMFITMSLASPKFLSFANISSVLSNAALNGCIAMGMAFAITSGGIDLSVSSQLAMSSVVIGYILNSTKNVFLACIVAVAMCTFFGFLNGFLIAKFNLFPFVVTLANQYVIRGFAYVFSGGKAKALGVVSFTQLSMGRLFDKIPNTILWFMGVSIIAAILMHKTKFGRYVYAIGGNMNAATASGVNVVWTRIRVWMFCGFCAGIAGIILTARVNAAQPDIGTGYETDAIAACVLGGTSFGGGRSTIIGVFVGVVVMALIYNGMNLLGIDSYWQIISKGALIIGSVLLDYAINKKSRR